MGRNQRQRYEPSTHQTAKRKSFSSCSSLSFSVVVVFEQCFTHLAKITGDLAKEVLVVGKELGHVPHHGTTEAAEGLGPLNGSLELGAVGVAATSTGRSGNTEKELDVGVLAALGPLVPDSKIEGVLVLGALLEVGDAAPVVVELDHDEVKGDGIKGGTVGSIGVHALRGGGQIELLATGSIHEAAEFGAESRQVAGRGLEVEVEAVNN